MKKVHLFIITFILVFLTNTYTQENLNSYQDIDFMELINESRSRTDTDFKSKPFTNQSNESIQFDKYELFSQDAKIVTLTGQIFTPSHRYFFNAHKIGQYVINISPNDHGKANIYLKNGNFRLNNRNISPLIDKINTEDNNYNIECATKDEYKFMPQTSSFKNLEGSSDIGTVEIYFEVDHYTYQDFDENIPSIINWVTEIFTQIKSIYLLHNINLQISEIKINDMDEGMLDNFSLNQNLLALGDRLKNDFEGNIAQLLTTKNVGGGRAYLNGLCKKYDNIDSSGPYAVSSGLAKTIIDNNYSWSVYVTTHEIGHLLGSPHTHACAWGINSDQALDNCHRTEGGCEAPTNSIHEGTIMSYCNFYGSGIDFTNGLGSEPSELIINNIINSACISTNNQAATCTVGSACDDENICTTQDTYDESCNCVGILIDINNNGICDNFDPCEENLVISTIPISDTAFISRNQIISTAQIESNAQIMFSAGQEIILGNDFEIKSGSTLEISISNCGN